MSHTIDPIIEERLRQGFRYLNRFMVLMWRLGLGAWGNQAELSGKIMVITHVGRKSGMRRRTPVNYAIVDGEVYCTAGFGALSDWYRNVIANPQVEVWLPDGWWAGVVEDVSASPQRLPIMRQVLIASGFAARLAGMNPRLMSDTELAETSQKYRLMCIHRITPCTGPGGPGDLAWVWPLSTMALLGWLLVRPRRK